MLYNIKDLINEANNSTISTFSAASGFSFGIVNAEGNGKRLSISKAISEKLGLEDSAMIIPLVDSGVVIIGKTLPFPKASELTLKGKEKKLAYNAGAVKLLAKVFDLDFSVKTSMSFSDITFDVVDDVDVAIVNIKGVEGDSNEENL